MTSERFAALLDAYGGTAERWPANERAAALAFVERTPAARAEMLAAQKLDGLIDHMPAPAPMIDPTRIVAMATAQAQERPTATIIPFRARRPVQQWARGLALAAAALAGFVIGFEDMTATVVSDTALDMYDSAQVEDALW